jgi:hypothetical protein
VPTPLGVLRKRLEMVGGQELKIIETKFRACCWCVLVSGKVFIKIGFYPKR